MSLKILEENIKSKNLQGIYLLYGDESYDTSRYVDKIKKSFETLENGVNFFVIDKTNLNELESVCEGMSFFGESKIVLIKDTNLSFNMNIIDEISNDKLIIVIVEKNVDKRTINYKTLAKKALCVEFAKQKEKDAILFVIRTSNGYKIHVTGEVAEYLISVCTKDKQSLINEFRKIVSYLNPGESLTKTVIDKICVRTLDAKIFDLTDYIIEKKKMEAISLYDDLIASKAYPPVMCLMLFRQFRNIYLIKLLKEKNISNDEIIKEIGIHPFVYSKIKDKINNYTIHGLEELLLEIGTYNSDVKIGRIDEILGLKRIIINI